MGHRLITHSKHKIGLDGLFICRAQIAAGRQPFGVDERLCVGGVVRYPALLAPKVCVPAVVQL
jgi:hypothetical protein